MKWRRKRRTEEQAGGEDSFLDIVANLVGILVILVMVIGVRAQDAWEGTETETPDPKAIELAAQREQTAAEHMSLTLNVHEVQQQAKKLESLVKDRQQERQQLQVLLAAARMELDERRKELTKEQQKEVAAQAEAMELEDQLAKIEAQRLSLEAEVNHPLELEHLPTPMARTVFGNEEHFRLKHGKLAYVPLNELTDMLKREIPQRVGRLRQTSEFTETLGPAQGFHLKYTMHRRDVATVTKTGPVVRQVAELKQFVLVPSNDQMGEPLETALRDGSQFTQMLEAMEPGVTVVTVWTYPDSFDDYRTLKKWLFDRGYSSAARPLPDDQPISGSPQGSRSAAQ